jgi:hypothetical protein
LSAVKYNGRFCRGIRKGNPFRFDEEMQKGRRGLHMLVDRETLFNALTHMFVVTVLNIPETCYENTLTAWNKFIKSVYFPA